MGERTRYIDALGMRMDMSSDILMHQSKFYIV